jgi:hypothetical protein
MPLALSGPSGHIEGLVVPEDPSIRPFVTPRRATQDLLRANGVGLHAIALP